MSTDPIQWGSSSPKMVAVREGAAPPDWYGVGAVELAALGDRVLIVEDQFKSGYECFTCGGSGKVKSTLVAGAAKTCPDCNGKGGVLVVPDANQRRPTTGTIVSVGEACKVLTVGEKVMFSNFAGLVTDFHSESGTVCVRILHETEVLSRMRGHLSLRDMKGQAEVTSI